jgi:hypothetical protein
LDLTSSLGGKVIRLAAPSDSDGALLFFAGAFHEAIGAKNQAVLVVSASRFLKSLRGALTLWISGISPSGAIVKNERLGIKGKTPPLL